jgi:hypothetical protein
MDIVKEDLLFEVVDILGKKVRTTKSYWENIIVLKHKDVKAKLDEIKLCLKNPELVERSKSDPDVYLYYRKIKDHLICVVVKHLNRHGFVITSYLCKNPRRGETIWPKTRQNIN